MSEEFQRMRERVSYDPSFQTACQNYAHGNGSSAAIAAAALRVIGGPDMLAALREADRFMGGFEGDEMQDEIDERIALIRSAIAKAEG